MMQSDISCFKCNKPLSLGSQVGFKESCPSCDVDLHCCRNCNFYDINAYNSCKEPQADRVVDKEKANFCDYFRIASTRSGAFAAVDNKKKTMGSLDDLFKK